MFGVLETKLNAEIIDDDLVRFFKLCAMNSPKDENVSSFTRWMDAVKPLIEDESNFLRFTDDFVTVKREGEDGFLEEAVERFVRKSGMGQNVRRYRFTIWHFAKCSQFLKTEVRTFSVAGKSFP